ncbi:hypothetical protein [Yersinia phage MHG19]|nr:hypothetical protein [Yersinia phage MHG19]
MTPRNNVFVCEPSHLGEIEVIGLRELMTQGSDALTPIEEKATFSYSWTRIRDVGDRVTRVQYYPPNSDVPTKTFDLHKEHYIPLSLWYSLTMSVVCHPEYIERAEEKARVRGLVKTFEEAAKKYAVIQQSVALVDCGEQYLTESAKSLSVIREELYKELGL